MIATDYQMLITVVPDGILTGEKQRVVAFCFCISFSGAKMKKLIAAVFIILPLAGCMTQGNKQLKNENLQTISQKIVKGKTTQQNILTQFGEPKEKAINDGLEVWTYDVVFGENQISNYIPGLALLTNSSTTKVNRLEIFFKGNVVDKYNFSQMQDKISRGLLD